MSQPPATPGHSAAERRLAQFVERSSPRAVTSPVAPRIDLVWSESEPLLGTAQR